MCAVYTKQQLHLAEKSIHKLRRVLCGVGADVEMVDFTSAIQEEPNAVITMIITSKT